ncbi:hypothetical protein XOO0229 [Xanthomonas oryzae pv. oryzae KACC 10331]|uniref:Uncharacterized protein n=1 Tax=Xanthomonas oryzae pv. oryzae (strain KACC10331 / KXO85) TaxID=291331 RepID=Q5H6D7_XANOR|nr:hypothetical protein XOO0229 [Xanthomonas oryzae pv. oryzae KACC 10331]
MPIGPGRPCTVSPSRRDQPRRRAPGRDQSSRKSLIAPRCAATQRVPCRSMHSARYLRDPFLQVVVVGDAGDLVALHVEERTARQYIGLPGSLRQTFVGGVIDAMHHVLGADSGAIVVGDHDDIAQLLAVTVVHTLQEGGEFGPPDFARALIEVVGNVVGQKRQHAVPVATVECCVIVLDQADGVLPMGLAHARTCRWESRIIGLQSRPLHQQIAVEVIQLLQQKAPAGMEAAKARARRGRGQRVDAQFLAQPQRARHVQRVADDDRPMHAVPFHQRARLLQILPGSARCGFDHDGFRRNAVAQRIASGHLRFGKARAVAEAAGKQQPRRIALRIQVQRMPDAFFEHRRRARIVGSCTQHDDDIGRRGLVAVTDPHDPARHRHQPDQCRHAQPPTPAQQAEPARTAAHAAAHGKASRSTLPPDRIKPTRRPANRAGSASTAARVITEDGSTTCLSNCQISRIAWTTAASSTVITCAPACCSSAKLGAPKVPRRPSHTVSGTKSTSRWPAANERAVSAAPAGSASTSSQPGAQRSASAAPAANPPPPTGATSTSRPPL